MGAVTQNGLQSPEYKQEERPAIMRASVRFREAPSPGNSPVRSIYLIDPEECVK